MVDLDRTSACLGLSDGFTVVSDQADFPDDKIVVLKDRLQAVEHATEFFRILAPYGKIQGTSGAYVLHHSQLAFQVRSVGNAADNVPLRIIGLHHAHLVCNDHGACWNLSLD